MCDRAVGEDSIPKQQLGPEHHRKKLWPARVMRHPLFFQQEFWDSAGFPAENGKL